MSDLSENRRKQFFYLSELPESMPKSFLLLSELPEILLKPFLLLSELPETLLKPFLLLSGSSVKPPRSSRPRRFWATSYRHSERRSGIQT
jgi:hypothetical protein